MPHPTPSPAQPGDLPQVYTIAEVRVETPTIRTFVLDGNIQAEPGQFVMAWLPRLDEKPLSLSGTAPDLTYTPDPDYHGPDSFTFVANDGTVDSAAATVSITVAPVNDPPVAT